MVLQARYRHGSTGTLNIHAPTVGGGVVGHTIMEQTYSVCQQENYEKLLKIHFRILNKCPDLFCAALCVSNGALLSLWMTVTFCRTDCAGIVVRSGERGSVMTGRIIGRHR